MGKCVKCATDNDATAIPAYDFDGLNMSCANSSNASRGVCECDKALVVALYNANPVNSNYNCLPVHRIGWRRSQHRLLLLEHIHVRSLQHRHPRMLQEWQRRPRDRLMLNTSRKTQIDSVFETPHIYGK